MIRFENVAISFGEKEVIKRFDCEFGKGINVIYGPSGCGKSSLLGALLSALSPNKEKITYPQDAVFSYCGPHNSMFYEHSLRWNLSHLLGISALSPDLEELSQGMDAMKLMEQRINSLSGGERKKTELLFCLAKEADIYVLDEPFSGLDEDSKGALTDYLSKERAKGCFVIASHDLLDDLNPDTQIKIEDGEGLILTSKPVCFDHAAPKPRSIKLLDCFRHAFSRKLGLNIIETATAFLSAAMLLLYFSILPPNYARQGEIEAYNDPNESLLFTGNAEHFDYEDFEQYANQSELLSLTFVSESDSEYYPETGGYLIPYEGDDFLLFQKTDGAGNGFNLSPEFSYVEGSNVIDGRFEYIEEEDETLDFLRPYSLFQNLISSNAGAILLCPRNCFAPVVTSLANGDFHSNNYMPSGSGFIQLPSLLLAPISYSPETDSLGFNPFFRQDLKVVDEQGYFLSLPKTEDSVNLHYSGANVPCQNGKASISVGAYCYLSVCSSAQNRNANHLGFLGYNKATLDSIDFRKLSPASTFEYNESSLQIERTSFLVVAIGLSLIHLSVFIASLASKKIDDLPFILSLAGASKKRKVAVSLFASSFAVAISIAAAYLLYFACFIPLFNAVQAGLDYPNGYVELGPLYEGISSLPFYQASWLALIPLLFILLPSLKSTIAKRKK